MTMSSYLFIKCRGSALLGWVGSRSAASRDYCRLLAISGLSPQQTVGALSFGLRMWIVIYSAIAVVSSICNVS